MDKCDKQYHYLFIAKTKICLASFIKFKCLVNLNTILKYKKNALISVTLKTKGIIPCYSYRVFSLNVANYKNNFVEDIILLYSHLIVPFINTAKGSVKMFRINNICN